LSKDLWPWLGLVGFLLGYFATWSVQFAISNRELEAGGTVLLEALNTPWNNVLWRLTSALGYISVGCLIWFATGLHYYLVAHAPQDTMLSTIIFGSFLVTGTGLLLAFSFRAQVFDGLWAYTADPSSHVVMNRLRQDTVLSVWAGLGAATAATSILGFRQLAFPLLVGMVECCGHRAYHRVGTGGTPIPGKYPGWHMASHSVYLGNSQLQGEEF
jgi:hypothetical protein